MRLARTLAALLLLWTGGTAAAHAAEPPRLVRQVLAMVGIGSADQQGGGGAAPVAVTAPAAAPAAPLLRTARNTTGVVGVFFALALLGVGLVTFGRQNLEVVSDTVAFSFGRAFVVGVLAQVIAVPTFGMLVVGLTLTVVGVLLVPFAAVAFALLLVVGIIGGTLAVLHAMGETWVRRRLARGMADSINSFRYLRLGFMLPAALWLCWAAISQIPVAGPLVLAAAVLTTWLIITLGFGATLLSRAGIRANFAGRVIPAEALTDEYLWATPQFGVPAVKRPESSTRRSSGNI